MIPKKIKILIVDDMSTIRDLIRTQLKNMGFLTIFEAENGEQAINMLAMKDGTADSIDFVISDWNMPKMTGLELLKQVRSASQWENLPFILLTSESEREQVTEAILSGVSQYMVKPFSGKAFEEKMKSAWVKHNKK